MAKVRYPFMVFAESLPEAKVLNDPKTPAEVRDKIRRGINTSLDIAAKVPAARKQQERRHAANREKRDRIMADWVPGRRGERRRLAKLHGVSDIQIKKWMEQLRKAAPTPRESAPRDWRAVYYGKQLQHQYRIAGRTPKKPQK